MNIQRILKNNITILVSEVSQGKTMTLCNLIVDYVTSYTGSVWTYGLRSEITDQMSTVKTFSSVLELETIKDSIIVVDEVGALFDLDNRKEKKRIGETLRLICHHNNRIVLCGLPTDFNKFLAGKATCYMYKSLIIKDLINRSLLQETILSYKKPERGAHRLSIPLDQVLCYDADGFWLDEVVYFKTFDTKINNKSLFQERK